MKAIILILIVFFSFSNLSAQEATSIKKNTKEIKKELTNKTDCYNSFIKIYNFDLKIKKNTLAKSGYHNRLLIKNGFRVKTKKSSRLASNTTINSFSKTTNS